MNLLVESYKAFHWAFKVLVTFWQVKPWTTFSVILANVVNRFCGVLAFFLPLKVILLAGSDGVPRYFQFFIDPNDKGAWIIGLSVCAVVFYIATLVLDSLIKSLSEEGGAEVLRGANEIAVSSRHRDEVKGYYSRFSGVAANLFVIAIGYALLGLINHVLLGALVFLVITQFLVTAWVLNAGDHLEPGRFFCFIREKLSSYLSILGSFNFLAGFFVLLIPFLIYREGNLLLAILSILLMRQTNGAIKSVAKTLSSLWGKRLKVEPMIFRNRHVVRKEKSSIATLAQAFSRDARRLDAQSHIEAQAGKPVGRLESDWKDPPVKGMYAFHLYSVDGERNFLQRVYPRSHLHLIEHEQYLFEHVDRRSVFAPPETVIFTIGPFECHVADYGNGEPVSQDEWRDELINITQRLWGFEVPHTLVSAYQTSHKMIAERVNASLLKRLDIALDSSTAREDYEDLLSSLSVIQREVGRIPCFLYNPDLSRRTVVRGKEGEYLIPHWERWRIETIGIDLPSSFSDEQIVGLLQGVKECRDMDSSVGVEHLRVVSLLGELEAHIVKYRYQRAIETITDIMKIYRECFVAGGGIEKVSA